MSGVGREEDKKPKQSVYINLMVKTIVGNEVYFRINRSTPLKKLMNAYCDHYSADYTSFCFVFAGRLLRGEQTPDEVAGMEDGDQITSFPKQCGC